MNQLNAPEPSRISRGALIGRTLLLQAGEEDHPSERRTMLLGEEWMLTLIQIADEPPLLELAARGAQSLPPPPPGELLRIDSAASLADLLTGEWHGERYHSMTGVRIGYERSVSSIDGSALIVQERLEAPEPGQAGPSARLRRMRLASRLDGRIELEQTPWRRGEATPPSRESTLWRGDLAGNVLTWRERQTAGEARGRLESPWLLIGRDLVIRMTQEEDGSWWFALERRTNG